MSTVLAALGSDDCAQPVLDTAIALGVLFDASVSALHVREHNGRIPQKLASDAGVDLRETTGSPIDEIVTAAQDPKVAAVVLGVRGAHGGPQPAGRLAAEVITRVRRPVVVVPPRAQPRRQIARILVPLEETGDSAQALEETIGLANGRGLEVLVLHVNSPDTVPAFADHDPHATHAWKREFLARHISAPRDRITVLRRLGVPADQVVTIANTTASDLIVLAWSQNLGPGRARVVSETLAHTNTAVLLLPSTSSPHVQTARVGDGTVWDLG